VAAAALILTAPMTATAQYTTMDRMDAGKFAELHFDLILPDGDDGNVLRTDIYGQITFGSTGVYFNMPFTQSFPDGADGDSVIGDLELGGFFVIDLPALGLVARAGLLLPTASDATLGELFTNIAGASGRITDLANIGPNHLTLRLSGSPYFDFGLAFARGDLGLDFLVPTGDKGDVEAFLRVNLAAGIGLPLISLAVELANIGNITSDDGDIGDRFIHTLGITATLNAPFVHPYVGFVTPLDEGARGEVYIVAIGVRAGFFD